MEYITASEIAERWNISQRRVQTLCREGRIPGSFKLGDMWAIPSTSKKPQDKRTDANQRMPQTYTAIDLFCGCGGLSYGFEQAGFDILLGIDNDSAALKTFTANHKDSIALNLDITQVSYKNDIIPIIGNKKIDFIIGGPPCQGMSLSGPRKFDDPRNKLYRSFIRLVSEIRPRGFIIENVPGLVGLFGGRIKDSIVERLTALGYNIKFEIINAADYGVPQNRRRVFFVGMLNGEYTFPEPKGKAITCATAISDLPSLEKEKGSPFVLYDDLSEHLNPYQLLMREGSTGIHNHIRAEHSDRVKHIISLVPDGGNYKDLPDELKNTRRFNVAWTRFNSTKPSPTIDTGHRHHFHYKYNRVPTVRECARIQSFPDRFIFYGNKTEQFRQVGNAVPPLLAEQLAAKAIDSLRR